MTESLVLHRAIAQHTVAQYVRIFVAVAVASGEFDLAGIAVGAETVRRVAGGVVVGSAAGVDMGDIIATDAHLESIAIAGVSIIVAFVVGRAASIGNRIRSLLGVETVIGVVIDGAAADLVA